MPFGNLDTENHNLCPTRIAATATISAVLWATKGWPHRVQEEGHVLSKTCGVEKRGARRGATGGSFESRLSTSTHMDRDLVAWKHDDDDGDDDQADDEANDEADDAADDDQPFPGRSFAIGARSFLLSLFLTKDGGCLEWSIGKDILSWRPMNAHHVWYWELQPHNNHIHNRICENRLQVIEAVINGHIIQILVGIEVTRNGIKNPKMVGFCLDCMGFQSTTVKSCSYPVPPSCSHPQRLTKGPADPGCRDGLTTVSWTYQWEPLVGQPLVLGGTQLLEKAICLTTNLKPYLFGDAPMCSMMPLMVVNPHPSALQELQLFTSSSSWSTFRRHIMVVTENYQIISMNWVFSPKHWLWTAHIVVIVVVSYHQTMLRATNSSTNWSVFGDPAVKKLMEWIASDFATTVVFNDV